MSETVALEVPDELARRVRAVATATHRRFEDVVLDWLRRAAEEPPVEALTDGELLALCQSQARALAIIDLGLGDPAPHSRF